MEAPRRVRRSLSEMGEMSMAGSARPWAAASDIGMWTLMMVAMMLPSLVAIVWSCYLDFARSGSSAPAPRTALVAIGYLFVWTIVAVAIHPLGVSLSAFTRRAPNVIGIVVTIAGALQLTAWKARQLACSRRNVGHAGVPCDARAALRNGVRLGLHCCCCCAAITATFLVVGDMTLRAMVIATAAISAERIAPGGARVARAIGVVALCAGLLLLARAA